jgi:DNA invertase Pin-like site-specific DNA recombinase
MEILEYGRKHDLKIKDFIDIEISSRENKKQRRIEELLEKLHAGNILIISELSRLGRSTSEVIDIVNETEG